MSIKRNDSIHSITNTCTDPPQSEGPIYSNLEELKAIQKPPIPEKNLAKVPLKKPVKKINKDDIQIASETDIKINRPPVKPKPNLNNSPQGNKPNVVIIKQGLASTTNEMVANSQHRMHNVGNVANKSSLFENAGKNANVANLHRFKK